MRHLLLLVAASIVAAPACADGTHAKKERQPALAEEHAFGREGDPRKVTRTVRIGMADTMRYMPAELKIRQGETVKFVVRNNGKLEHEMVLGTLADLKAHADMMKKHPGMTHEEPQMVEVRPGKTGILVWQFTKAGTFYFGCLEPGHFEAGMIGKLEVVK